MKVGSKTFYVARPQYSTNRYSRAKIEARTCTVTTQNRESIGGEAEEGEEASEEGTATVRDYGVRTLTSIGSNMAL
jgi:hypothetical protein